MDVSEDQFQLQVLDRSEQLPVVVDFWAPWCAPCRALTPVLEQEIAGLDGQVALVKVNIDENPGLATQYRVQSIPAVKAFRESQLVAAFEGARDVGFIRRWLQALVPPASQGILEQARALILGGKAEEARPLLATIDARSLQANDIPAFEAVLALAARSPAAARGDWEAALEELLATVAASRRDAPEREAALATLRGVFELLGSDDERVRDARRRLQIIT